MVRVLDEGFTHQETTRAKMSHGSLQITLEGDVELSLKRSQYTPKC